jgi:hypothetical protein
MVASPMNARRILQHLLHFAARISPHLSIRRLRLTTAEQF